MGKTLMFWQIYWPIRDKGEIELKMSSRTRSAVFDAYVDFTQRVRWNLTRSLRVSLVENMELRSKEDK